jgi:hypothetical protein
VIEIPRPDGTELSLDYRQPYGSFDHDLDSFGVVVRVVHPDAVYSQAWSRTIDMTPSTASPTDSFDDAALYSRHSWTDPLSGVTIAVGSVNASGPW